MSISFLRKLFGDSDPVQPETGDSANSKSSLPQKDKSGSPETADFEADDEEFEGKANGKSVKEMAVPMSALQEFVGYVVKNLVDFPDQVTLDTVEKNRLNIIRIHCAKTDIGKIIGKSGKTISALRLLVQNAAGRGGNRVTVDVLD